MSNPALGFLFLFFLFLGVSVCSINAQTTPFWSTTATQPNSRFGNTSLVISPVGDTLIVGTIDAGIWLSPDGGDSWQQTLIPGEGESIFSLAHMGDGLVLAGGEGKIFRSVDGGDFWETIFLPSAFPVRDFVRNSKGQLFLCTADYYDFTDWGDGVFRSDDGGRTWQARNSGFVLNRAIWRLAVDSADRLFASMFNGTTASGAGLFLSENDGNSWVNLPLQADGGGVVGDEIRLGQIYCLEVSPEDSLYLSYLGLSGTIGLSGGLRQSLAGARAGEFWDRYSLFPVVSYWLGAGPYTLYFTSRGYLLGSRQAGPSSGGPYVSKDRGSNWVRQVGGLSLTGDGFNACHFAERTDGRIYMIQEADPRVYRTDRLREPSTAVPLVRQNVAELSVFPNPFRESLTLIWPEGAGGAARLQLIAPAGRIIREERMTGNAGSFLSWQPGELPAGLYILRLETRSGIFQRRVVVSPSTR